MSRLANSLGSDYRRKGSFLRQNPERVASVAHAQESPIASDRWPYGADGGEGCGTGEVDEDGGGDADGDDGDRGPGADEQGNMGLAVFEGATTQCLALCTNQVVPVASDGTAGYHAGLLLGMDADVSGDALSSPVMAKPAVPVVSVTSQRQRVQRQTLRQPSDDFWPVRNADLTALHRALMLLSGACSSRVRSRSWQGTVSRYAFTAVSPGQSARGTHRFPVARAIKNLTPVSRYAFPPGQSARGTHRFPVARAFRLSGCIAPKGDHRATEMPPPGCPPILPGFPQTPAS